MDYAAARRAGEPQGSGAMESTCRQYQCRFKRPGQFWSCVGDEGLMCLETFWRNRRWHLLFPHILHGDPPQKLICAQGKIKGRPVSLAMPGRLINY